MMAYYNVTFKYSNEEEKTRFIEGVKDLKEFIELVKTRGGQVMNIMNHEFKDVTKRYVK